MEKGQVNEDERGLLWLPVEDERELLWALSLAVEASCQW